MATTNTHQAEKLLRGLQWHEMSPGGHIFAPIGQAKLESLMEDLGIPRFKIPRMGHEILLHKQGDAEFWVANGGGRFTVKAFGPYSKVVSGIKPRPDTKKRSPWRNF